MRKFCYSSKTLHTNCKHKFLIETPVFIRFLKIIGGKNQLHITFRTALVYIKDIKG